MNETPAEGDVTARKDAEQAAPAPERIPPVKLIAGLLLAFSLPPVFCLIALRRWKNVSRRLLLAALTVSCVLLAFMTLMAIVSERLPQNAPALDLLALAGSAIELTLAVLLSMAYMRWRRIKASRLVKAGAVFIFAVWFLAFMLTWIGYLSNAAARQTESGKFIERRVPADVTKPPAETPSQPVAIAHPVVDDQSLPNDHYISLGLPSYDRPWTGQDMAVAASQLQTLAAAHPEQLPRLQSVKSGKVFARIVSPESLSIFRNRSLPLNARMPQALQYMESTNAITKLYLSVFLAKKVAGDDVLELLGAVLRVSQVMLELTDEFVPTLSKDDPTYEVRMEGLDKMRHGLAMIVVGALVSLTEEQNYSIDSRLRFVKYCRETLSSMVPKLSAPSQAEVVQHLNDLADDPKLRGLQPELTALRDEVAAATKAAGQP